MDKVLKGSWRTTASGIVAALAVVFAAAKLALDGKASEISLAQVMEAIAFLSVAFGLVNARDNKVSSEEVGAK